MLFMNNSPSIPIKQRKSVTKRWKKVVMISLIMVVIILIVISSWIFWMFKKEVPKIQGAIKINGLDGQVTVVRDKNGVPHIKAANDHDLYLAQGFITAQDRLFQMDLSRRQASGELSEVVGKATVHQDEFFRTFGLRRAAEASYNAYNPHAKQVLQWYAEGVNAFIKDAEKTNHLPVAFHLLGYKPKPWTPIDSLTIGKYMAFDLGGHWEGQAFRSYLLQNFSKAKALDLFPSYPKDAPSIIQANKDNPMDLSELSAYAVKPNPFNGSNNWVVSGKKTASGKPYLANDPHLGLSTPSIWYETHLQSPSVNVSGVVFAGIPGIVVGHNSHIAWGVTNVGPDVQDLYIEKQSPNHPNEFLYMGKWEKAKILHEEIKVKGKKAIPYQVTITRHGPIISDFAHDHHSGTKLAMRWTALDPTTELQAILMMDQSSNWNDFKKALTYFQAPAQNFVFASDKGTIAYRANGLIPIRKKGNGQIPVPGWTNDYGWKGYIPWNKLPTIVNPSEGFIATANNKVVTDQYPYHITDTWAQPYREERIRQFLQSKPVFTISDMETLQFDHKDMQAEEFIPMLLPRLESQKTKLRPIDKQAIALLNHWNKIDAKNASAPLVFRLWMKTIPSTLFKGEIKTNMLELFDGEAQVVDQLIRHAAKGNPGPWISEHGGLDSVLLTSFQAAVDRARKLQGSDPSKWVWGDFHQVNFPHPLSAKKPLNYIYNPTKPVSIGGSSVTVGAAAWNLQTGRVTHGAPWRSVTDLARLNKSEDVVGPGESGHVLSAYYNNQVRDWTTDGYHTTYTDYKDYSQSGHKLVLNPAEK